MHKFKKLSEIFLNAKYKLMLALFTFMATMPAHAAVTNDSGVIKILKNIMDLAKVGSQTVIYVAFAGGVMSLAYAFWLFRSAGEPNGQSKGVYMQILLFCVAGGGLLYLGVMGTIAGETLLGTDAKESSSINTSDFGL